MNSERESEIGMIAKISLTAAFAAMIALSMACATSRAATNRAPIFRQEHEKPAGTVVAQQQADGAAENGNDSDNNGDSNDNSDDNQNADSNQTDQQYPPADVQPNPAQAPNGNEQDSNQQFDPAPQPQPVNPYQ